MNLHIYYLLLAMVMAVPAWAQQSSSIPNLKPLSTVDSTALLAQLNKIDSAMNVEQYENAQLGLNVMQDMLNNKQLGFFQYIQVSRQAEVYYYNNLKQLGLQQSFKAIKLATQLNDTNLLADGYNFSGLFYLEVDSLNKAATYLKKAINTHSKIATHILYQQLSMPYHYYGNIAETYLKMGHLDSAIIYAQKSEQLAYAAHAQRAIAVAQKTIGFALGKQQHYALAIKHLLDAQQNATLSKDVDVALICCSNLANVYAQFNKKDSSRFWIQQGMKLLNENTFLNNLFAIEFLTESIDVLEQIKLPNEAYNLLKIQTAIQEKTLLEHNKHLQVILAASVENESRVLNLQIKEVQQKQNLANSRFIISLVTILLLAVSFWYYHSMQQQKHTVQAMRNKLSRDLHDDIGASLSSLQIYSSVASTSIHTNPEKSAELLKKITEQTALVMENMDDIVWSMLPANNSYLNLVSKIKNYGADLLHHKNIQAQYFISDDVETNLKNILARKNVLLITKEAINNIAKYSQAKQVTVEFKIVHKFLQINIKDDGIGFDPSNVKRGNGLHNMQDRTTELNGRFTIETNNNTGTNILIKIPVTALA